MDLKNPLHTAGTYRLARAEQIAIMLVCAALLLWHRAEVNWWRAAIAFVIIDVVGVFGYSAKSCLPVAMSCSRRCAAFSAIWAWASGPEWAMLAVPLHLSGDRGLFGNVFKPVGLPFEPVPVPEVWSRLMGGPAADAPAVLPGPSLSQGWQS